MGEDLMGSLRSGGPVSPAVQMRTLLAFGKERGWTFETAWRWSFERVKFPHDTTHRRGWKEILGEDPTDPRKLPSAQRAAWRRAYENEAATRRERSVGVFVAA
jgi:hypothetical protein